MRLTLTGMSGSGKSFWSMKLSECGFLHFCCDDLIAARLLPERAGQGENSIELLGEWMGYPFDHEYREREDAYLACEREVLKEVIEHLEADEANPQGNITVDTTGSVIYTGDDLLNKLRKHTTVVHLSTPVDVQKRMLQAYMAQPRPVLWRGVFSRKPAESNKDALARCYPELLSAREKMYKQFADLTFSYDKHHSETFGVNDFLAEVEAAQRQKLEKNHESTKQ